MSLFITFEGGEGAGKSTQIKLLAERLANSVVTREPGGTKLYEQIRELLLDNGEINDPLIELMLLSAGRLDHVNSIIKPALAQGRHVICDRFFHSTIVYQCLVKGLDRAIYDKIAETTIKGFKPDITFYLDLPPNIARQRLAGRMGTGNHYDNKSLDFHEKIREGFLSFAGSGYFIIDASKSISEVHAEITACLNQKFQP